jgi:hypothetical protein
LIVGYCLVVKGLWFYAGLPGNTELDSLVFAYCFIGGEADGYADGGKVRQGDRDSL